MAYISAFGHYNTSWLKSSFVLLLQKGAPFCPTRLFGWQTTNDLAAEGRTHVILIR